MRTAMTSKTRAILLAGAVSIAAGGAGAAYLALHGKGATPIATSTVQVYVTAAPVPAGTAGATALADGRIHVKAVAPTERPAAAVTDPSQLSGRVAGSAIAAGTIVTTDMFPAPQTHIGTVVIPAGERALSLELQPVPGIAGFAGAGDHIDVYGVVKGEGTPDAVRLVLQGVLVLNVNGAGLPTAQGQPGSPDLIYLVAVTPADAERLIFLSEFDKLYFDLIPAGEGPVKTPGAGPTNVLGV